MHFSQPQPPTALLSSASVAATDACRYVQQGPATSSSAAASTVAFPITFNAGLITLSFAMSAHGTHHMVLTSQEQQGLALPPLVKPPHLPEPCPQDSASSINRRTAKHFSGPTRLTVPSPSAVSMGWTHRQTARAITYCDTANTGAGCSGCVIPGQDDWCIVARSDLAVKCFLRFFQVCFCSRSGSAVVTLLSTKGGVLNGPAFAEASGGKEPESLSTRFAREGP